MPTSSSLARGLAAGLLLVLATAGTARAAEMNCTVSVDYRSLGRTDIGYLDELQSQIERYVNDRAWTGDRYDPAERIACNIQVQFTSAPSQTRFRANYTMTTRRPIYGSTQLTTTMIVSDSNWDFEFVPGTQLTFDPQRYDAITSLLNYYIYLALGYDYDSFSALGGTRSFELARDVLQVARGQGQWQATNDPDDRGNLVTQLLDARFQPVRQATFDLHFNALDVFTTSPEEARAAALASLRAVHAVYEQVSKQAVLDVLLLAKGAEIVSMLEKSSLSTDAYSLLSAMDPAGQTVYSRLLN